MQRVNNIMDADYNISLPYIYMILSTCFMRLSHIKPFYDLLYWVLSNFLVISMKNV